MADETRASRAVADAAADGQDAGGAAKGARASRLSGDDNAVLSLCLMRILLEYTDEETLPEDGEPAGRRSRGSRGISVTEAQRRLQEIYGITCDEGAVARTLQAIARFSAAQWDRWERNERGHGEEIERKSDSARVAKTEVYLSHILLEYLRDKEARRSKGKGPKALTEAHVKLAFLHFVGKVAAQRDNDDARSPYPDSVFSALSCAFNGIAFHGEPKAAHGTDSEDPVCKAVVRSAMKIALRQYWSDGRGSEANEDGDSPIAYRFPKRRGLWVSTIWGLLQDLDADEYGARPAGVGASGLRSTADGDDEGAGCDTALLKAAIAKVREICEYGSVGVNAFIKLYGSPKEGKAGASDSGRDGVSSKRKAGSKRESTAKDKQEAAEAAEWRKTVDLLAVAYRDLFNERIGEMEITEMLQTVFRRMKTDAGRLEGYIDEDTALRPLVQVAMESDDPSEMSRSNEKAWYRVAERPLLKRDVAYLRVHCASGQEEKLKSLLSKADRADIPSYGEGESAHLAKSGSHQLLELIEQLEYAKRTRKRISFSYGVGSRKGKAPEPYRYWVPLAVAEDGGHWRLYASRGKPVGKPSSQNMKMRAPKGNDKIDIFRLSGIGDLQFMNEDEAKLKVGVGWPSQDVLKKQEKRVARMRNAGVGQAYGAKFVDVRMRCRGGKGEYVNKNAEAQMAKGQKSGVTSFVTDSFEANREGIIQLALKDAGFYEILGEGEVEDRELRFQVINKLQNNMYLCNGIVPRYGGGTIQADENKRLLDWRVGRMPSYRKGEGEKRPEPPKPMRVTMRCYENFKGSGKLLEENFPFARLEEDAEPALYSVEVMDAESIVDWALRMPDRYEVVEPQEVREKITQRLRNNRYLALQEPSEQGQGVE